MIRADLLGLRRLEKGAGRLARRSAGGYGLAAADDFTLQRSNPRLQLMFGQRGEILAQHNIAPHWPGRQIVRIWP